MEQRRIGGDKQDGMVPDSVQGTGFFTPMDIAPGEIIEDFTPPDEDSLCDRCGFAEWRHRDPNFACSRSSPTPPPKDADGELKIAIFRIFDDLRVDLKFKKPAAVYVEQAEAIEQLIKSHTANAALEAQGEYNLIRRIEKLTSKMDDDYGEFDCLEDIETLLRERAPIVEAALHERQKGPTS